MPFIFNMLNMLWSNRFKQFKIKEILKLKVVLYKQFIQNIKEILIL